MKPTVAFTATDADAGHRLDTSLVRRLARPRAQVLKLIREGRVLVDGDVAKASHPVKVGETIAVSWEPVEAEPAPQSLPLRIVYEDADLIVVDKPAGMATHPAPGSRAGTLVNALLAAVGTLAPGSDPSRPGIVHRLDKDTSGLLIVARSARALPALQRAIQRREAERRYHAVVWGVPAAQHGIIEAPIGRDPHDRTKFAVRESGRRARTHFKLLEKSRQLSLLEALLETGRTHQLRVHFSALGNPIVGDRTYSNRPALGMERQALHAVGLRFVHPFSGEELRFESPWPEDFAALVDRLRADSQRPTP